ncbi:MAG: hypothetical protein OXI79_11380 [Gammaproteobacteria bacterium]|nr:hypothetical protein [Gammaproteobacteria bacterium]
MPSTVAVEDRPVVILDNKDWITLSQPRSKGLLGKLKAWAAKGVRFPVTHMVFEELCDGSSTRQRQQIAQTIEVLGNLTFVYDPTVIWVHEVEAALSEFVGSDEMRATPIERIPYVTDAFGLFGESVPLVEAWVKQHMPGVPTDHPGVASVLREMQQRLPRDFAKRLLESPPKTGVWSALLDDKLVPQYNKVVESYRNMDTESRGLFLRRLASVVVVNDIMDPDILKAACVARGRTEVDVLKMDSDSYGNTIVNVMPSLDALVVLSMGLIEQGNAVIRNDLQDIRHLATTVPYADFVMTDRRMMRLFHNSGLVEKARAKVLYRLEDLVTQLDDSS